MAKLTLDEALEAIKGDVVEFDIMMMDNLGIHVNLEKAMRSYCKRHYLFGFLWKLMPRRMKERAILEAVVGIKLAEKFEDKVINGTNPA